MSHRLSHREKRNETRRHVRTIVEFQRHGGRGDQLQCHKALVAIGITELFLRREMEVVTTLTARSSRHWTKTLHEFKQAGEGLIGIEQSLQVHLVVLREEPKKESKDGIKNDTQESMENRSCSTSRKTRITVCGYFGFSRSFSSATLRLFTNRDCSC